MVDAVERKQKVAVVTGSNRGLGLEVAKGLCQELKEDGIVYITCRNKKQGAAAVKVLEKYKCHPKFYQLNVTNIYNVEDLKYDLREWHGGFDILVNNAAINYEKNSPVPFGEQAEEILKVNFYFMMHITAMLWGALKPYARVVNVACGNAANLSLITSENIRSKFLKPNLGFPELMILMNDYLKAVEKGKQIEEGWPDSPYDLAKMGVVAMTREQQNQFDKSRRRFRIIVNCVNPGDIKTSLTNFTGTVTPKEGAKPVIKLALLPPNITSPKGKFVWNDLRIVDLATGNLYTDEVLASL